MRLSEISANPSATSDQGSASSKPSIRLSDIQPQQSQAPQEKPSALMAIPTGVNSIIPQTLGMPMDFATNVANLAIAGYGALKGALGAKGSDLPDTLGPPIGGSQWIANKINQGISDVAGKPVDVFSNPRPDSKAAQMLHTISNIAASGLTSPANSVREAAANVKAMVPSGIGAAVAQQIAPNSPLAPVIGSLVAPTAKAVRDEYLPVKPPVNPQAVKDAIDNGLIVPPSQAEPTLANKLLESISGKIRTQQSASIKNQPKLNDLAAQELGLEAGTPITRELLNDIRSKAGQSYEAVRTTGEVTPTPKYFDALDDIAKRYTGAAGSFPQAAKNQVGDLIDSLKVNKFDAGDAVDMISILRENANKAYATGDKALGAATKRAANALEDAIGTHLEQVAPNSDLLKGYQDARQTIAKTYSVEKALNDTTGNISAANLAKQLEKGVPLSGGLKTAAEFGQAFPKAAQLPEKIGSPVSKLEALLASIMAGGGVVTHGIPGLGLAAIPLSVPPAARALILSRPYQRSLISKNSFSMSPSDVIARDLVFSQLQRNNMRPDEAGQSFNALAAH